MGSPNLGVPLGSSKTMILVVYVISLVAFCVGAFIVPMLLAPVVWVYKAITKEHYIHATHPVFFMTIVAGSVVLLHLTRYTWAQFGYNTGWLFPTIVAITHILFGIAPNANLPNRAQASGTVCGVVIYALSRVLA